MLGLDLDSTLMMCRSADAARSRPDAELLRIEVPEDIVADCDATGRATSLERVRMRSRHGLRYFSLREAGRTIAGTWVIHGGRRFLDEAMLLFEMQPGDACLRDVFVAPGRRGERVFQRLVDALECGPLAGMHALWSCVDAGNRASVQAHAHSGFECRSRIRALRCGDWLLLRSLEIPAGLECRAYESRRRVLRLDERARAFRAAHLA